MSQYYKMYATYAESASCQAVISVFQGEQIQ